jgi:hypothetical protein
LKETTPLISFAGQAKETKGEAKNASPPWDTKYFLIAIVFILHD